MVHADKYFDSNGVRIRYVEEGSGEPVVLIHGFTDDVERAWIDAGTFDELAKHYHVIAFDYRGHGKSGKPHDPQQYGREAALDVVRLLDHLHIERAHKVGYSMGGIITAYLLTIHPERFLTATLGGVAPGGSVSAAIRQTWATEIEQGSMRSLIVAAVWPTDQPKPTEEQLQQMSAAFLAGNDPLALAAQLRSGGNLSVQQADLAAVRVPILGVAGSADAALARLNALKTHLPQLTVVEIQGAGHQAARLRPELGQAVKRFLAAHPAGRP
jgi:pimeloyl-ACP methyl ester carboxylesterase